MAFFLTSEPVADRAALAAAPTPGNGHLRALLNGMPVGVLTFDASMQVLFTNTRLVTALDLKPAAPTESASVIGLLRTGGLFGELEFDRLDALLRSAVDGSAASSSLVLRSNGVVPRFFTVQVAFLEDGQWSASFDEVTSRRADEAQAIERAMRDPLTGLPSRPLFEKRVLAALGGEPDGAPPDAALPNSGGPALMMIDLDRFKAVNDTLGHPVGDAVLRVVAKRLQSVVRPADVLARLGGDEFALLTLAVPERDDLGRMAARIVDTLGRPYLIDGHLINIGASIGLAVAPDDGADYAQLLRSADLALYHAKQSGRGTFSFFKPEMDRRARARRALEIDLRRAMALREFELHYQPQIDLDTSSVVGFEALLRWRHPERGLVSPADFIPLAEEIGLIVPLGDWVMREACCEAMRWPAAVSVAVNVSSHQFGDTARLVDMIARSLELSGLPGRRLEIEITESVLLREDQLVLETLHRLRDMEVRVAMDDFGTGYSSLSQLHSFPFDKIKIDRSFVKDRGDVVSQNAIIRAITALGLSLGISTIAEGVETSDQLRRIRAEGCTSVQGYLFSKPVPAHEVAGVLAGFVQL